MGQNGPTLVPDEVDAELRTEELPTARIPITPWTRRHPLLVHPSIEAHHAVGVPGTGIFVSPRERSRQAGASWVRRSTWWLQVHAPPDTPGVLDSGLSEDGLPWAVLETPPGSPLRSWRDEQGPLSVPEVVAVATLAAGILHQIHTAGWAHQAVSIDTVYRSPAGSVHLFGWGMVGNAVPGPQSEQGGLAGARGDIAGLGVAMLEALSTDTRVLLRAGRISDAVAHALPDPTVEMRVLRHLLGRAVHPDPAQRWDTMEALFDELQAWQESFGRGRWA